ncbi:angiopoietin-related protein 7-like isoform X2 [Teleopsis dalmanni]|uniref:angiopoietin-related protein 7-like isoform X2 n=1 Tax=Teleopsis dalmanni TaxID=139649 RepID=UPI0018CF9A75|nr:angiopoietin-related protein 7-like isoform X2 [Teleopsis dalmanni]
MHKTNCNTFALIFGVIFCIFGTLFVNVNAEQTAPVTAAPHSAYDNRGHRNGVTNRWNRLSPSTMAPHICEYKEVLDGLHDRVGILATIDEDLRSRLEKIDQKLNKIDDSNTGRLESMSAQQMDFLKRLDSLELIERMTKRDVEELKGDNFPKRKRNNRNSFEGHVEEIVKSRETRQVSAGAQDDQVDPLYKRPTLTDSQKLDAIATLLTETTRKVQSLRNELVSNITSLSQTTSHLHRRLNVLQRRQQNGVGVHQQYLPPVQPPVFYAPPSTPQPLITSCAQNAVTDNSILRLQLTETSVPFYVRCDESFKNGGWTIIFNRFLGDTSFQRDWAEYKSGFGNLAGDFFIGLEKLHALTSSAVHELVVILEDFANEQAYARYNLFGIGSEDEGYALNLLGNYTGTAGDSLTYHAGYKFSTYDMDNDGCLECNCAQAHMGAWWYNWCEQSNLFGKYYLDNYSSAPSFQGMYWHHFRGPNYSLRAARMMIRPVAAGDATTERR